MKLVTVLALTFVLVCSFAALAASPVEHSELTLEQQKALKQQNITGVPDPQFQVGGEDIPSAVNIPVIAGYSDAGNTCAFLDDYDEICPYSGSTSADVVYKHTPGADIDVDISLCASLYDTKLYVYENSTATLIACNDDACGFDGFESELLCVPMRTGNTYYVVVDGFGGACGDYDLSITECTPCIVDCPSGSILEGEPVCLDDYNDTFNGGCNSTPNVFSPVPCSPSLTICGEYGGFFHSPSGFDYRDTDWYELPAAANTGGVTMSVVGSLDTLAGYIDATLGCGAPVFEDALVVGACDPAVFALTPGAKWLFVATSGFGAAAGACGSDYTMALDGLNCPPVSVEATSWADIKAKYHQE